MSSYGGGSDLSVNLDVVSQVTVCSSGCGCHSRRASELLHILTYLPPLTSNDLPWRYYTTSPLATVVDPSDHVTRQHPEFDILPCCKGRGHLWRGGILHLSTHSFLRAEVHACCCNRARRDQSTSMASRCGRTLLCTSSLRWEIALIQDCHHRLLDVAWHPFSGFDRVRGLVVALN